MKNKLIIILKKTLLFVLVAGISCVVLSMATNATGLVGADGFLGTIVTFTPVILPIVLGTMAIKRIDQKDSDNEETNESASVKKPVYKRWWFWVIIIILVLGSCDTILAGTGNDELPQTTETTAPAVNVSIDTAMSMVDDIIQLTFENYTIEKENHTIRVSIWQNGASDVILLARAGNMECLVAWNDFIESQQEFCSKLYELIQALGESDISVELNVLDDRNKTSILLSTVDGIVVYDCLKD